MSGIDTDVQPDRGARARPVTRRICAMVLVFAGGAAGTATREAAGLLSAPLFGDVPMTLTLNVVGAFLLGALRYCLDRSKSANGRHLLMGTGFLGGFTTYSALAAHTVVLAGGDVPAMAVVYALGSLILGVIAAGLGVACAGAPARARRS